MIILDGWFYKFYGRVMQNPGVRKELLDEIMNILDIGDSVFLLQENPEVCWSRRTYFKQTEMGAYQKKIVDQRQSFVEFQTKVNDELKKQASRGMWNLVNCNERDAVDIAKEIGERILENAICKVRAS